MNEAEKFRHDRSTYERPNVPFRCGRAVAWGQPCWQGPDARGDCGGQFECSPTHNQDRWECRRPTRAGGPCKQGPLPDGQCCNSRPLCQPRPSLRRLRGRVTLMLLAIAAALIFAFSNPVSTIFPSVAAIDPGPLSNAHAGFIGTDKCESCHVGHTQTGIAWLAQVFEEHDNDAKCLQCHTFDGPSRSAHNRKFPNRQTLPQPECATCHKEHKGAEFDLAAVSSQVCGNCHTQQFNDFSSGHPQFAAQFPYQVPNAIYFDHNAHLQQHFASAGEKAVDAPAVAEFAQRAKRDCTACHEIATATREVTPRPFEQTCGHCHQQQITARSLPLLLADSLTPASALLLGTSDDADDADEQVVALIAAMAEGGLEAFAQPFEQWQLQRGEKMLEGLTSEVLQAAAKAWENEDDYTPPATDIHVSGWHAGTDADENQSIRYEPRGHRDPVLKAWFDVVADLAASHKDAALRDVAKQTLEQLLDSSEGPGACGKCHVAGITSVDSQGLSVPYWGFRGPVERRHTSYAHAPHLNLLGGPEACGTCHIVNPASNYADYFEDPERQPSQFMSNFEPIVKNTCDSCHKPSKVRFDCQLCHTYHRNPSFNVGFQIKRLARNE
jgi:hypothetical protein